MSRAIAMLIIGLIFGGGLGFVLSAAKGVTLDGHDHATDHGREAVATATATDHAAHQGHDALLVLEEADAPTLTLEAFPDPVAGWNLHIRTTDFVFAPRNSGLAHVDGEGHAHVYANGVKLGRVYGPWVHLDKLPEGPVEIEVTLNANDHRPLAVGDAPISARLQLSETSGG